jgi:signal transduction histidine kinase
MLLYQESRKYEDQQQVIKKINNAIDLISEEKSRSGVGGAELKTLNAIQERIETYREKYLQSIQAMRGSLFLSNVVMAGEAEEFAIVANKLKELTLAFQNELTQSVSLQREAARRTTLIVTSGTIFLGLLFSLLVTRSITSPIRRISKVFQELSRGEFANAIPGINRNDEIGALAESATVFRNVNARTASLLLESETLTSDLKSREKQLQFKTKELEKSNDQLDQFAYVASHDLKSPLRAISNLSAWIKEDCAELLPESSKRHLDQLSQRILRMENLLSDLLTYSRVGKVEESIEDVSL